MRLTLSYCSQKQQDLSPVHFLLMRLSLVNIALFSSSHIKSLIFEHYQTGGFLLINNKNTITSLHMRILAMKHLVGKSSSLGEATDYDCRSESFTVRALYRELTLKLYFFLPSFQMITSSPLLRM